MFVVGLLLLVCKIISGRGYFRSLLPVVMVVVVEVVVEDHSEAGKVRRLTVETELPGEMVIPRYLIYHGLNLSQPAAPSYIN